MRKQPGNAKSIAERSSGNGNTLDEFLSDIAEVFGVPKHKVEEMVHQFEVELEVIPKGDKSIPSSTPAA